MSHRGGLVPGALYPQGQWPTAASLPVQDFTGQRAQQGSGYSRAAGTAGAVLCLRHFQPPQWHSDGA